MPRVARIKSIDSIYHVMIRSISEIDLFKENSDKIKYLSLIKKYENKYQFKIYAYCLLDNHGHLMIDVNGADISKIMHCINFCYAQYYNFKYKRHGHVFQDRFKSKIIDSEKYLIMLSAYIHNNPKDLPLFKGNVKEYPFSSLREYVKRTNDYEILDKSFLENILQLHHKKNMKQYLDLVDRCNHEEDLLDIEFEIKDYEYRSEREIIIRDYTPNKIISDVAQFLQIDWEYIYLKHSSKSTSLRALSAFMMMCFCNMTAKEICKILGNITAGRVSNLSLIGVDMYTRNDEIKNFVQGLMKSA
ncbi:transposase [Inediibacterium massiliense]|uniref:transposase n=1 Tax=Inediibacterium massiliense TaxID=1658111 RepID=UPI0006B5AFE6|nr:transposase [Inediibacterium massiliense]